MQLRTAMILAKGEGAGLLKCYVREKREEKKMVATLRKHFVKSSKERLQCTREIVTCSKA